MSRDQQICSSLEEKLQVYAALSALSGRTDALLVEPRLLVQPHSEDPPQAAMLLAAALKEGETDTYTQAVLLASHTDNTDQEVGKIYFITA